MPSLVLVGLDMALLEGIAQTLASAGYRALLASSVDEATGMASAELPFLALIQRGLAMEYVRRLTLRVPLAPGGAIVLFHSADEAAAPLPPALQRITLADLTLPLERHRLVALVRSVDERLRHTGRDRPQTPPETRAV